MPKEKAGSASALLFRFVTFLFLFGLKFLDFVVFAVPLAST